MATTSFDLPRVARLAAHAAGATSTEHATERSTEHATDPSEAVGLADLWVTIVWNDPVNLMTYVSYVFESYFGFSRQEAELLMLQVHEAGRAVVSNGGREKVERDVQAMHDYGLWATMQRSGE